MGITIAIATYNRADELAKTLASLEAIDYDHETAYEVLVVDNNSTDDTRAVATQFAERLAGRLRYVKETRQGLSHARNRAIDESRYEIIAFLDDDVDVDANWFQALTAAHREGTFAAIGGRAYLNYPAARPAWLGVRDEGLLTKVELGPDSRRAAPDELYGVNLSFRKEWLDRVGPFRVDLGRVGNCLMGSEESELLARMANAGGELLYEPLAVVGHRVPMERLRRRWFWARCYWGFYSEARILPADEFTFYCWARTAWWCGIASGSAIRAAIFRGPQTEEFFHGSRILACHVGFLAGLTSRLFSRPISYTQNQRKLLACK